MAISEKALLENLVKVYDNWAEQREQFFRENLTTYDPVEGDQPCEDWEMNDYDEMDEEMAFNAVELFESLANLARGLLEKEK